MGKLFSYMVGISIAGLIVFGLYFAIQVSSSAYARQISATRAAGEDLDGLEKMLKSGIMRDQLAAITAIGKGDDEIDRRVRLLAVATGIPDNSIQAVCNISIRRLGEKSKAVIRKMLQSKDPEDFRIACGAIRALGTEGDEFAEAVAEKLRDGDEKDRHAALYALQDMSPDRLVASIDEIILELEDENFNTQCAACFVLRSMGPKAKSAVGPLVKLLQEGNISTKSRAAQALAAIGPTEGYDVPGLVADGLGAFSQMQKVRVLDAMGVLGPDAIDHLPEIERLIQTPRLNCVPEAALAYYKVSGKSEMPMKVLTDSLSDRNRRLSAIECLGGMGEVAASAVPQLMEYLGDEDLAIKETAILAMKAIGPAAKAALPKLNRLTKHDDYLITVAANEAIAAINATSK